MVGYKTFTRDDGSEVTICQARTGHWVVTDAVSASNKVPFKTLYAGPSEDAAWEAYETAIQAEEFCS